MTCTPTGLSLAQGYLFSRPVPGQELTGRILRRDQERRRAAGETESESSRHH